MIEIKKSGKMHLIDIEHGHEVRVWLAELELLGVGLVLLVLRPAAVEDVTPVGDHGADDHGFEEHASQLAHDQDQQLIGCNLYFIFCKNVMYIKHILTLLSLGSIGNWLMSFPKFVSA